MDEKGLQLPRRIYSHILKVLLPKIQCMGLQQPLQTHRWYKSNIFLYRVITFISISEKTNKRRKLKHELSESFCLNEIYTYIYIKFWNQVSMKFLHLNVLNEFYFDVQKLLLKCYHYLSYCLRLFSRFGMTLYIFS